MAATALQSAALHAELSYLTGEIEQARTGVLGPIGSAFDFDGFGYRAVVGYDLLENPDFSLTPTLALNGANISFDNAVETGGFGFTVDRDHANFMNCAAGLSLLGPWATASAVMSAAPMSTTWKTIRASSNSHRLSWAALPLLCQRVSKAALSWPQAHRLTCRPTPRSSWAIRAISPLAMDAHAARASVRVGF